MPAATRNDPRALEGGGSSGGRSASPSGGSMGAPGPRAAARAGPVAPPEAWSRPASRLVDDDGLVLAGHPRCRGWLATPGDSAARRTRRGGGRPAQRWALPARRGCGRSRLAAPYSGAARRLPPAGRDRAVGAAVGIVGPTPVHRRLPGLAARDVARRGVGLLQGQAQRLDLGDELVHVLPQALDAAGLRGRTAPACGPPPRPARRRAAAADPGRWRSRRRAGPRSPAALPATGPSGPWIGRSWARPGPPQEAAVDLGQVDAPAGLDQRFAPLRHLPRLLHPGVHPGGDLRSRSRSGPDGARSAASANRVRARERVSAHSGATGRAG